MHSYFFGEIMNKRKCLSCGKEYHFCPRCEASKNTPWMVTFDCVTCKDIFNVVSGYNMGISTLEDVKEVLKKNKIEDVTVYKGTVKDVLMQATKPAPKTEKADIELKEKKDESEIVVKKSLFAKGISK